MRRAAPESNAAACAGPAVAERRTRARRCRCRRGRCVPRRSGWDELESCTCAPARCALHQTRTQGVFGVGNRKRPWMVIGEAPGADEDRQGEPFVGRAGQLLNSMLKAIGLAREQVFIANILKSRPPNNRDPQPEEVRACIPYLYPPDRAGEPDADPVRRPDRRTDPAGDRYADR